MTAPSPDQPAPAPPATPPFDRTHPGPDRPQPPAGYPPPTPPGPHPHLAGYPYPYPAYGHPAGFAVPAPVPVPVPTSPGGQPLASFADRLLAVLIDSAAFAVVGIVLLIPLLIAFFFMIGPDLAVESDPDQLAILGKLLLLEAVLVVVMALVGYGYYVEWLRRSGQTLGKKVMKLRVVPIDPAEMLSRGHCLRRYLVQWASAFVAFLGLLSGPHGGCERGEEPA